MDRRLLQEFMDFSPPGHMAMKADRTARLCVKMGHIAWAVRIREKNYGRLPQSDMAVAARLCLMAQQTEKL